MGIIGNCPAAFDINRNALELSIYCKR